MPYAEQKSPFCEHCMGNYSFYLYLKSTFLNFWLSKHVLLINLTCLSSFDLIFGAVTPTAQPFEILETDPS